MECPKCNYNRLKSDHAPEWQCPSCGVAYNKVKKSVKAQNYSKNKAITNTEKNDWIIYIMLGIGIFLFTYFDSLDGMISWYSESKRITRDISLENQQYQYYFFLGVHYFFSLLASLTGVYKLLRRKASD
ncbi:hypothetical protein NBRC116188_25890 [Oceaniserpentilla sp. 4NH20-0058]